MGNTKAKETNKRKAVKGGGKTKNKIFKKEI